jgi:transcription elongation factor Elf1
MTHTTSIQSAGAVDPPTRRAKSVLFCPTCGHESPVNGDWVRDGDAGTSVCPNCQTVIGVRNGR